MTKRKVANPLALAVLGVLLKQPMHPYEMACTMREWHKEESVRLNYGSLYTVVEALHRTELISSRETVREGRRPERTIYELTDAGREEFHAWLGDLIREPVKEYPQFLAGLAFLAAFTPDQAVTTLRERARRLGDWIRQRREVLGEAIETGLPRIVLIEVEYELAMAEAELAWVRALLADIEAGGLAWPLRDPETGELVFTAQAPDAAAGGGEEQGGGGMT